MRLKVNEGHQQQDITLSSYYQLKFIVQSSRNTITCLVYVNASDLYTNTFSIYGNE